VPFGRLPVSLPRAFADDGFLFLAQRLPGRLHDARIDHLAAARNVAESGQMAINGIEYGLIGTVLDQAFLEGPNRRPVRDLAAGA